MGANSSIEWTNATFNPWWGCQKVSEGCTRCYAETLAKRYGHNVWGPAKTTGRREMSPNYWKQPARWEKEAAAAGVRRRVFCASMADVFEDHPQLVEPRRALFHLISDTPWLDWLLLTKRPENILRLTRAAIDPIYEPHGNEMGDPNGLDVADFGELFPNVWLGTSVEDQRRADERIPELLKVSARVRFLSCEPLLGPVDLATNGYLSPGWTGRALSGVQWVICGGESGHGARLMQPEWAKSLRDQCQAARVAFFMKQMGGTRDKGGSYDVIPEDLQVRALPV